METMVEARGLVKIYKRSDGSQVQAVNGIDLDIYKGEIFSLLGPNGAGKTTTISMISGLTAPTEGDARIGGYSITKQPMEAKRLMGVIPQEVALYPTLSACQNLEFFGKMYGLRGSELSTRVDEVLEFIGLVDRQKDRIDTFSGGMKRRVNIGVGLLHRPKLVYMDEPTVGIDPQSRRNILDSVKELNHQGMTVLYTTHYMEEAQELSNHIAIMDHGKVIAYGTHEELIAIVGELDRLELAIYAPLAGGDESAQVIERWRAIDGVHQVTAAEGRLALLVDDGNLVLPRLFDSATQMGVRITSVEIQEPNLEAVFLHLTGRDLRD